MTKTFMFDYDDTLAPNEYTYSRAEVELVNLILNRLRKLNYRVPNTQKIIELQVKIDTDLVEQGGLDGFNRNRFPLSFQLVYEHFCNELGVEDPEGAEMAHKAGLTAFDKEAWKEEGLIEGAAETLDFLVEQGDELILITKGDPIIQNGKIDATGCRKWFEERIHIVPVKTAEIINEVVGSRDKSEVWHVGNLKKSDIRPAQKAGIGQIYIPFETWAYETEDNNVDMEHPRLNIFPKIIDIITHYPKLK